VTTLPLPRRQRRDAGAHRLAVDMDRAGAALGKPAAEMGVVQPQFVSASKGISGSTSISLTLPFTSIPSDIAAPLTVYCGPPAFKFRDTFLALAIVLHLPTTHLKAPHNLSEHQLPLFRRLSATCQQM
jgi:hypothetical protein